MKNNIKKVKINGVEWEIWSITYEDLVEHSKSWHVSDWVWDHAIYNSKRLDTGEQYWLSYFYKRDIKDIMACDCN